MNNDRKFQSEAIVLKRKLKKIASCMFIHLYKQFEWNSLCIGKTEKMVCLIDYEEGRFTAESLVTEKVTIYSNR